jgi:hypothetical protein
MASRYTFGVFAAIALLAAAPALAQRGPAPGTTGLGPEVLALACAPSLVVEEPPRPLRITGGQDPVVRRSYAPGDLITINAGTDNGIDVGQEYYTRRVQSAERRAVSRDNPGTIRTTGWIRIYAVDTKMSLATITHACDTLDVGDYLEPFALPQVPVPDRTFAKAQRDNYGRILLGTDRRRSFGKGDFFIVDRGSDHGVYVGARFVVYRDKRVAENFLYDLGEAVAVDVRPESSTLQVTVSRDGFKDGDYVAIRK